MKTTKSWRRTVQNAHQLLHREVALAHNWRALWTTPFYSFVRVHIFRKEDPQRVFQRKLNDLHIRRDRITRRYGE